MRDTERLQTEGGRDFSKIGAALYIITYTLKPSILNYLIIISCWWYLSCFNVWFQNHFQQLRVKGESNVKLSHLTFDGNSHVSIHKWSQVELKEWPLLKTPLELLINIRMYLFEFHFLGQCITSVKTCKIIKLTKVSSRKARIILRLDNQPPNYRQFIGFIFMVAKVGALTSALFLPGTSYGGNHHLCQSSFV